MSRSNGLLRAVSALHSQTTVKPHPKRHICRSCLALLSNNSFPTQPRSPRHHASTSVVDRARSFLSGQKSSSQGAAGGTRQEFLNRRLREQPEGEYQEVSDVAQQAEYKAATTWDGLEHVGYSGEWWEKPELEEEKFIPYLNPRKITHKDELFEALHRATVEVFALKEAGRDLLDSSRPGMLYSEDLAELIRQVEITVDKATGAVALRWPNDEVKEIVMDNMAEVPEPAVHDALETSEGPAEESWEGFEEQELGANSAEAIADDATEDAVDSDSADPVLESTASQTTPTPLSEDFLTISLDDPVLKFAILKRTTQLTAHIIPDPALPNLTTLSDLYYQLLNLSAPKPKTMYEILTHPMFSTQQQNKKDNQSATTTKPDRHPIILANLPNVKIHERRQTPIDREREVGRWKVIERELTRRGLPVTGHRDDGHVVKNRHGNGKMGINY